MISLNTFILSICISLLILPALANTTEPSSNKKITYTLAKGFTDEDPARKDAEIFLWRKKHGHQNELTDKIYTIFNTSSLEVLSNNGDVKAMLTLANSKYWDRTSIKATIALIKTQGSHAYEEYKLKSYNDAIELYELAINHGSTKAIGEIMRLKISSLIRKDYSELSDEDKKTTLAEVLTWYEFSRLRGDRYACTYALNSFFKDNTITLTPDDIQKAKTQAAALYNNFATRRAKLGLGAFDNYEPDSIKKWSDKLLANNPYEQLRNQQI